MRAIHIGKLDSLEADTFINAFVRFCARRGLPEKVWSDNGTNFVEREKKLRETMRNWKDDSKAKSSSSAGREQVGVQSPGSFPYGRDMGKGDQNG